MEKVNYNFKLYFSRIHKRPNKNNYEQYVEAKDIRKEIKISFEDKNKKFFDISKIYFSIESNFDCTANLVVNFGKLSMYIYEGTLSTKQIKELRKIDISKPSFETSKSNYFKASENEARNLFRLNSMRLKDNEKFTLRRPETNANIFQSNLNFLKKNNNLIKLREDRTKSVREFNQNKLEKDVLIKTLKVDKRNLKTISVYINKE